MMKLYTVQEALEHKMQVTKLTTWLVIGSNMLAYLFLAFCHYLMDQILSWETLKLLFCVVSSCKITPWFAVTFRTRTRVPFQNDGKGTSSNFEPGRLGLWNISRRSCAVERWGMHREWLSHGSWGHNYYFNRIDRHFYLAWKCGTSTPVPGTRSTHTTAALPWLVNKVQ